MAKGLVLKSTGSWYNVKSEHGDVISCKIKGRLRNFDIKSTNPVVVGDWVEYDLSQPENTGLIKDIYNRKNYIIRKSPNLSKEIQIIAANIDLATLIITLTEPKTTTMFIDRFLVIAEAYRIPVILVINKTDLYDKKLTTEMNELVETYELAGYTCLKTSAIHNTNTDELKKLFKDKISVIAGNSGVGKSTIIKAIDPELTLRIGAISEYHKSGKHTTTFAEMFELSSGGHVIDTPGIKGFGLIDVHKNELYHFFPEIFNYSKGCQFYNCLHLHEPGCAVQKAVEEGKIAESRYVNYATIYYDKEDKYRK